MQKLNEVVPGLFEIIEFESKAVVINREDDVERIS